MEIEWIFVIFALVLFVGFMGTLVVSGVLKDNAKSEFCDNHGGKINSQGCIIGDKIYTIIDTKENSLFDHNFKFAKEVVVLE